MLIYFRMAQTEPLTDIKLRPEEIVTRITKLIDTADTHSLLKRITIRYEEPILILSMRQREQKTSTTDITENSPSTFSSARIFCSPHYYYTLLKGGSTGVLSQLAYIMNLPGLTDLIVLPDVHLGKVFPVGFSCTFDLTRPNSVFIPELIGSDINCGVRLWRTNIKKSSLNEKLIKVIVNKISQRLGISKRSQDLPEDFSIERVLMEGLPYLLERGIATENDISATESKGSLRVKKIPGPEILEKGLTQLGTLGEGNHYAEIQFVSKIFNSSVSSKLQLSDDDICISVHTGSRGVGGVSFYKFLKEFREKNKMQPNEVAEIPVSSDLFSEYLDIVHSCSNFAFCNRVIIGNEIFQVLKECIEKDAEGNRFTVRMESISDSAHNMMRIEGENNEILSVRKGSTQILQETGDQNTPSVVSVGGSMSTGSYILSAGINSPSVRYFTCHGSGRILSRTECKEKISQEEAQRTISEAQVQIKAKEKSLIEESSMAYKCIDKIVDYCELTKISEKICRLSPIATIKG